MPRKLRKSTAASKSEVNQNKENKEDASNLSLPVLSEEKIFFDDKSQKKSKSKDGSVPGFLIPKVRLTCLPLNIEQVIDLSTNKIVKDGNIKKKPAAKRETKAVEKTKKLVTHKPVKKPVRKLRPRFKDEEEYRYLYNSPSSKLDAFGKKIKIYIKESKFNLRKDSVVSCKNQQKEENNSDLHSLEDTIETVVQTVQTDSQNFDQQKSKNEVEAQKAMIYSEVNHVNFGVRSDVGSVKNDECKLKERESTKSQTASEVKSHGTCNEPVVPCSEKKSSNSFLGPHFNASNEPGSTSLQAVMESFINSSSQKNEKDIVALKNGLCQMWMSNNYKCTYKACPYHHNATSLFTKKLKRYPFKYMMTILLALKNDTLFVDAVLAAFKVLSERKAPTVWMTFLIYFVFYVTEPSDSRFFKFWATSAKFFYRLGKNFSAARGFASLLSIFSHGDKPEEWKIIEFIKFIKQPPIQIHSTYDLLQPVLKLNLPSQFLVEAVECSIATERDVLEVYSLIIPKISIKTSPIPVVELLLKFCNTLESLRQKHPAEVLKQKLREKVQTFKIRIFHKDYPWTAVFQEEILSKGGRNHLVDSGTYIMNSDWQIVLRENNYFLPDDDFFNIIRTIETNCGELPGNFSKADEKVTESSLTKEEEDVSERQVSRVKQFFTDCHFDVLGKYLNGLKSEAVEQTVQEFLKALFQMRITLQQVLDLVKIILLHCSTETAAKINASICVTLIVNLVRINEWEKAHIILSICEEKGINMVEGKVYFNEFGVLTQFRVLLLMVEIYMYKENFQTVLKLVKSHFLYSANSSLWKLAWNNNDEAIRVRIVEEFLEQTISKQLTNIAYDLFMLTWIEQNTLISPIDLKKSTNDILILLLNQNTGEGVKFFEKIRRKVSLNETATRAILVTLAGKNNLQEAKSIMMGINQTTYTLPEVTPEGATVTMSSLWLEEEIYVILDSLFDVLTNEMNPALRNYENFEVNIHIVKPKETPLGIRPLCLGLINPSLEHACKRIERVLQHQFQPPIKLIILPYSLLLDKPSLRLYLERRFCRGPG